MSKLTDITGQRFGRLIALKYSGQGKWFCQCDCGNKLLVKTNSLTSNHTKSCGCLKNKHNMSNTRLYNIYSSIKQRCYYKKHQEYSRYGGRGIAMCEEWKNNPKSFFDWAIENGYKNTLTIDRIDINGNYTPKNCRWITLNMQQQVKSNCKFYTINGETHNLTEWAKIYGIKPKTIFNRVSHNWDIYKALTTPIDIKRLNLKYRKEIKNGVRQRINRG